MRRSTLTILVLVTSSLTNAHEFWLRPKKFLFAVGEVVVVDLVVGENFNGEYWDLTKHKVDRLELVTAFGKKDLAKSVKPTKGKNVTYKTERAGLHLFNLQSSKAFIELDGEKFNAYLEEDGIENILNRRKERNELNLPAKEHYQRFAKLLVQAGNGNDEVYKRVAGFPLEIIPLENPYKLRTGDYLECRVLENGSPSAHRMVKVWSIVGDRVFIQNIYTENDGTLKFPLSSAGPWMVSTVRMIPSDGGEVDYESQWASLVFGVQ